jgi:DNA-binding winged helix-turn-helix (wHTH) protein/tetratricopeptide (TPR) repeat protein
LAINAILRASEKEAGRVLTTEQLQEGFALGEWDVLPNKGVLCRGEEEIHPEPKVLAVLLALACRDGDLVTKDELIEEVWDGRAFGDEPIQRCIALLRKHFGDSRPYEYIETLQRRGYRLLKPVKLHVEPDVLLAEPPDTNSDDARLWKIVAAVVAAGFLGVLLISTDIWGPGREPIVKSIAILPMENLSGDPSKQYIVVGTQNTLAYRLSGLQEFATKNVRLYREGTIPEIAASLGVESILNSSLQMMGDTLKVTWHIVNGADNVTVASGEVTGDISDLFTLQEELAQDVRNQLAGPATPQLVSRYEPESAAYNSFVHGMFLMKRRGGADNLEAAMALFQESISRDRNFGPAYLALANAYALLPDYRQLPLEEAHRLAIATVEQGVLVDPSIEDAAASIYGFVYHQQKRWHESESAHLQAVNASVVDANSFNWYSRMLASVGRREDALNWILKAEHIDPDNPIVINRIALAYLWLGDTAKAQEYFQRAAKLGAGGRNQLLGYALLLMRHGQFEQAQDLAAMQMREIGMPVDWVAPVFTAFTDPTLRENALAVLDRQWAEQTLAPQIVLIARIGLGDVEGAMEIAQLLEHPGEIFEMDLLFIDELEPLRRHRDFIPLMERLGVVEYWDSVGCVWDGSQVNCATASRPAPVAGIS